MMLVSVPLFVEYEAVLKRAEHLMAAGVSAGDVDAVVDVRSPVDSGRERSLPMTENQLASGLSASPLSTATRRATRRCLISDRSASCGSWLLPTATPAPPGVH